MKYVQKYMNNLTVVTLNFMHLIVGYFSSNQIAYVNQIFKWFINGNSRPISLSYLKIQDDDR